MFLDYQILKDRMLLSVRTGPMEKYDPNDFPEIKGLFEKIKELDKKMEEMRNILEPQILSIKKEVEEFNVKQAQNISKE